MVQSRWKIARIQRLENALLENMISTGADDATADGRIAASLLGAAGKALANLQRYAAGAERTYHKCYRELIRCRQEALKTQDKEQINTLLSYVYTPQPSTRPLSTPIARHAARNPALRL